MKRFLLWSCLSLGLLTLIACQTEPTRRSSGVAQQIGSIVNSTVDDAGEPFVGTAVSPSLSRPVRDIPVPAPDPLLDREIRPRRFPSWLDGTPPNIVGEPDSLLAQNRLNTGQTPSPLLSFEGINNRIGGAPPDTVGDVGRNYYVQMVNVHLAIYDKSGVLQVGPIPIDDLWEGAKADACNPNGAGDPIVLYDELANRWLVSQFADPNHMCVAVSQTADPTGAYHLYTFDVGFFPDYFKFGVWPDGYYMSANEASYTAYVFDRESMLAGQAASFVKFSGQNNLLMPSDVDGAAPPAGAPNYFYTFKDDQEHGGPDRIEIYAMQADWAQPNNTTFSLLATIPVAPFTYTVCGFFNFQCVPQPGTSTRLDSVSEWPMFRWQYRNFGTHETLVGNFAIDVGSDRAGIRWFELRKSGAGEWQLRQEGTHAPGSHHYFMGSAAMDREGNIALGYSASSTTLSPSIHYAVHQVGDPLGTLQAEAILHKGNGSQTGTDRWGDYSALSVDPADGCTFWYTTEYYASTSSISWRTRIGTFRLPNCEATKVWLPFVATP